METNDIKVFTDEVIKLGYRVSPDAEGQIRIADAYHGLMIMRVTNVGKDSIFELTSNDIASEEMVTKVTKVFNEVLR